ncbi:MAG: hypothetical protein ACO1SX_11385 [Actinomycetota bacterium]
MKALPLFGAVALGVATIALCAGLGTPRSAGAQIIGQPQFPTPPLGIANQPSPSSLIPPPPIEVEALDTDHFVMVTREPRLVQSLTRQGGGQNMLLTVVTHYTVRPDKLIPVEHVRVPDGYRLITLGE